VIDIAKMHNDTPHYYKKTELCFSGTVTKNQGAGPRQYQISPLNSMIMGIVYQMANILRVSRPERSEWPVACAS
jgi:hypothetical protein